jgi:predicted  nucleic acid-binding Zn-ribbon protein
MNRSTRGAAKVSIVWTIVALTAFILALVMFFLTNGELASTKLEVARQKAELDKSKAESTERLQTYQKLSENVGFYDESATPASDLTAMGQGMKSLREAFPDVNDSVKNVSKAIPIVIKSHKDLEGRIKDQETQIASLRSENETKTKTAQEVADAKDKEIADLRRQLADTEQAKTDQQAQLERSLAEANENFKDRDAKLIAAKKSIDDAGRKAAQKEESLRTRLAEQGRKLDPFVKEPEAADGKVLEVSRDLNLGWIDLGSKNRLAMGTRFRVVSGLTGDRRVKGWAEVTQIRADMAEVAFTEIADAFDPPAPGDEIFNPLFDATGERHAVLLGRFSGAMGESELKALLAGMNIQVQKAVDKNTDF